MKTGNIVLFTVFAMTYVSFWCLGVYELHRVLWDKNGEKPLNRKVYGEVTFISGNLVSVDYEFHNKIETCEMMLSDKDLEKIHIRDKFPIYLDRSGGCTIYPVHTVYSYKALFIVVTILSGLFVFSFLFGCLKTMVHLDRQEEHIKPRTYERMFEEHMEDS